MKYASVLLTACLLATFAACQSTDTFGPSRPDSASGENQDSWTTPSNNVRPDVEHGDAYRETMLDRYGND
jgi:hypothetical protein